MALEELYRIHQRMLWGLCYRMTGCAADADDIVQETFVRAIERGAPADDPGWRAWLVRVAVNRGLDLLRARKRRRYRGPWLPSPIEVGAEGGIDVGTPEARYESLESVTFAFLLALEGLTPRQRAVLLLRDVLDYSAAEAGAALAMSAEYVRLTHLRARRAMQAYDRNRCRPTRALQVRTQEALQELLRCLVTQDAAALERLLAASVRTMTDGGGEFTALPRTLVGRSAVAVLHLRVARRRAAGARIEIRTVNGLPAAVIEYAAALRRQAPRAVLCCALAPDGRIAALHSVLASRKLTAMRIPAAGASAV